MHRPSDVTNPAVSPPGSGLAAELSAAISRSGLTLDQVRQELATRGVVVSVATLSYWQNGRSQPAVAHAVHTLTALEKVLGLPPGRLAAAAPVAQTRSRGAAARSSFRLPATIQEAVEQSRIDPRGLRKVSTHFSVQLAADRSLEREVVRSVVQCVKPGTASFPIVAEVPEGQAQEVTGLSNCAVGEVYHLPHLGLVLTEMVLPRPLRQGELLMLEYMTSLAGDHEPCTELVVAVPRLSELVLEVLFAWDDEPGRVVSYMRDGDEDDLAFDTPGAVEVPVSAGLAQLVRLDVPPSVATLRWSW